MTYLAMTGNGAVWGGTLRGFASLLNYLNDSAEESIEELSSIPRV